MLNESLERLLELARWGGDEFVLALWEKNGERTMAGPVEGNPVLDRIGKELAENPIGLAQGDVISLTYSAGVCRYTGSEEEAELETDDVLALADRALYEAKQEKDHV